METRGQVAIHDEELDTIPTPSAQLRAALAAGPEHRLLHILLIMWQSRGLIFRLSAYIAMATLLYAILSPNQYRSTTELMPPDSRRGSNLAAIANLAGQLGGSQIGAFSGDMLGLQSTGALFVGILQSHTARENLVSQFDLRNVYGLPKLHLPATKEDALKELERNTEVSEDRKSGIISISVADTSPDRAAGIARGYVDQLNKLIVTLSTSAAGRERAFLEQRLVEVKKDLDDASRDLSQFSSKNSTLDPKDQGIAMVTAAANLQGELIAAESQLQGMSQIYASNNVRIRSLQARIAELKRQLSNVSGGNYGSEASASAGTMPFPSIRALPLLGATYSDLYRRAKIQEAVYEVLTQQYEMAKVEEAKEIPTVRVLDLANVPKKKWGPHRGIQTLLGAIIGMLLGCALALAVDEWNRRDPDDPYRVVFSEVTANLRRYEICRGMERIIKKAIVPGQKFHIG